MTLDIHRYLQLEDPTSVQIGPLIVSVLISSCPPAIDRGEFSAKSIINQ